MKAEIHAIGGITFLILNTVLLVFPHQHFSAPNSPFVPNVIIPKSLKHSEFCIVYVVFGVTILKAFSYTIKFVPF